MYIIINAIVSRRGSTARVERQDYVYQNCSTKVFNLTIYQRISVQVRDFIFCANIETFRSKNHFSKNVYDTRDSTDPRK